MGRDTFHQTRLLKAPFNLVLSRETASTTSLGNLLRCLTTSKVKKTYSGVRVDSRLYLSQHCALVTVKSGSSQVCVVKGGDRYKLQKAIPCLDKMKICSLCCCKNTGTCSRRGGPVSTLMGFKNLNGQGLYKPALALMLVLIRK